MFESLFNHMSGDPDFEYGLIDGPIIRAHQTASGATGGLSIRPSKRNREDHIPYDEEGYRWRYGVENDFGKIKEARIGYTATGHLAATVIASR